MEKFVKWLREKWTLFILSVTGLCIIVAFIIHAYSPQINSEITADGLLSYFVGAVAALATLTLALVSVWQAQKANDISQELLRMQKEEYQPVLAITSFIGLTNKKMRISVENMKTTLAVHTLQLEDNSFISGYTVSIFDEQFNKNSKAYYRMYELNLEYKGKSTIQNAWIKSVKIKDASINKKYVLDCEWNISFVENTRVKLLVVIVSNHDFLDEKTDAFKLIDAREMVLSLKLLTVAGFEYISDIGINKVLLKELQNNGEKCYVEDLISTYYKVEEI